MILVQQGQLLFSTCKEEKDTFAWMLLGCEEYLHNTKAQTSPDLNIQVLIESV